MEPVRVIRFPVGILVERGVKVQEIREETSRGNLAGELVEVIVRVFRKIADAPFLFPYLDREDGGAAVSHTLVCGVQNLPDDATSFGGNIGSIVYRTEYHLVAST